MINNCILSYSQLQIPACVTDWKYNRASESVPSEWQPSVSTHTAASPAQTIGCTHRLRLKTNVPNYLSVHVNTLYILKLF